MMMNKIQQAQSQLMKEFLEEMSGRSSPKRDALCLDHEYNVDESVCQNCLGTYREPIPLREVMKA
jgi:hypothetical protein